MARHPVTCLCGRCAVDGTGDFAMREAFAVLRTDHDGRADKRTTFADGLCQPMGMELAPCPQAVRTPNAHSVYVGEGEKLWLFHDDDGDDKVDRREIVFSGFGTGPLG